MAGIPPKRLYQPFRARTSQRYWKTKEGKRIHVRDLPDDHLISAIQMLRRTAQQNHRLEIEALLTGPEPHGDGAVDTTSEGFTQLANRDWSDYVPKVYRALAREAERRHLEIPDEEPKKMRFVQGSSR